MAAVETQAIHLYSQLQVFGQSLKSECIELRSALDHMLQALESEFDVNRHAKRRRQRMSHRGHYKLERERTPRQLAESLRHQMRQRTKERESTKWPAGLSVLIVPTSLWLTVFVVLAIDNLL